MNAVKTRTIVSTEWTDSTFDFNGNESVFRGTIAVSGNKGMYRRWAANLGGHENAAIAIEDLTETIDQLVAERVQQKLHEFLQTRERKITFRKIADNQARKEIEKFITQKLSKGVTTVNILDIVSSLNLHGEQAERILESFESEGRVREI